MIDLEAISKGLHVRSDILKKIMVGFEQTLVGKLAELAEAHEKSDVLRMRALLHEIRGTSGNLRLQDVYNSAVTLHEAVKAGEDKTKTAAYLEDLKKKAASLSEDLK